MAAYDPLRFPRRFEFDLFLDRSVFDKISVWAPVK